MRAVLWRSRWLRGACFSLVALAFGCLGLLGWALVTFRLARTAIYPNQPASLIVMRGPYRLSRNPMYVALTAITLGIALLLNSPWILALLPVVLGLLMRLVILREEAYLTSAFGEPYKQYKTSVRRWL